MPITTPRPPSAPARRRHGRPRRHAAPGFTLIETALATIIIGVGVVAIIEAQQAFMRSNNWSSHAATATFLGNEIRELTLAYPRHDAVTGLSLAEAGGGEGSILLGWGPEDGEEALMDFDDADDFDGLTFGTGGDLPGPVDASGAVVPQTLADGTVVIGDGGEPVPLEGWSQQVIVEKVNPVNLSEALADDYREEPTDVGDWRDVDEFPVRVTVVVTYQGPFASEPEEVTRVTWIIP